MPDTDADLARATTGSQLERVMRKIRSGRRLGLGIGPDTCEGIAAGERLD